MVISDVVPRFGVSWVLSGLLLVVRDTFLSERASGYNQASFHHAFWALGDVVNHGHSQRIEISPSYG